MKFDYNKTYYKVTNEKENHHDFQYKNGLNVLKEKFNANPIASCVRGGFYFTDENNILEYLSYGCWIREVSIPINAKVILDPSGDKWRTNKIILGRKYTIPEFLDFYFDNLFDKEKFNYTTGSEFLAMNCPNNFDKWFVKKKYNYKNCSGELALFYPEKFDKWFNKKKYNYEIASRLLAEYCPDHFDKWFDKERFNYANGRNALIIYCSKYYDKWI